MITYYDRDLSEKEMLSFFRSIPRENQRSFGLMGGWAVTYLLKNRKIEHMGSRDIDIFYDPAYVSYDVVSSLISHQGFEPHSTFRWIKYFDRLTGRQISEAESRTVDQFNLITIYMDLVAPLDVGEHVLHEPLLRDIFAKNKREYWNSEAISILMPDIDIMVRVKIKSAPQRVDSFKREKDLVDLIAILRHVQDLWITKNGVQIQLREDIREHAPTLKEHLDLYSRDGTLSSVARALGLDPNVVLAILERL